MNGRTDRRTDRLIGANLNAPMTMFTGYKKTISNVIEKLVEHGIHCLPCSYTNYVINNIIIATMTSHYQNDVTAEPHSAKGLCKTFDNFVVAMVIDL